MLNSSKISLKKKFFKQKNNNQNNFSISNEMYKELILSSELNDLLRSSIAIHASYTLINASYVENSLKYKNDILIFIDNINCVNWNNYIDSL